ncbi:integrase core domain-containing protein, partial [Streptomyces beigongshangae]|uniref:integrase core domain-containing protein n=1 Tax=Streptomyces beigongshangae TaxID=2841597 RepID=UPI001C84DA8D
VILVVNPSTRSFLYARHQGRRSNHPPGWKRLTVGDALDNALMESQIGLYKTELIKPRKPWRGLADVELATAEWVDWFNNQRLHTAIGDIPPHEHETNYYAQLQPQPAAGVNA